ncbi:hypothetical protein BDW75DRAFT_238915 [Aspergillus navahoensis]
MLDASSITITLNLTGTILSPNTSYSQDAVSILLDTEALCALTEEVKRTLTEAGRIPGNIHVRLRCEDIVVHVFPTPKTKINHEVLKSLKPGDHARRLSTLQVQYRIVSGDVFVWHVSLDSPTIAGGKD